MALCKDAGQAPSWSKFFKDSRTTKCSSDACLARDSTVKQNSFAWVTALRSTFWQTGRVHVQGKGASNLTQSLSTFTESSSRRAFVSPVEPTPHPEATPHNQDSLSGPDSLALTRKKSRVARMSRAPDTSPTRESRCRSVHSWCFPGPVHF